MRPRNPWSLIPGRVYLGKLRARRRRQSLRTGAVAGIAVGAVFAGGLAITNWNTVATAAAPALASFSWDRFSICKGPIRRTCVIDGDTFWLKGEKIRIADIDTPETSEPKCQSEYETGMRATYRLRELLNEGPFQLAALNERDEDRYGRKLRIVLRDGQSIGDQLVSEGYARTWSGSREPWC